MGALAAIPYKTFPEISILGFQLHTFGLFVGLGVLLGVWLFARHMERCAAIDRDTSYRFAFWVVVVGFAGARLTYVLTNLDDLDNPLDAFAVWEGGLQFAGGFIGGVVFAAIWLRRHPDFPRWHLLDGLGLALTAGLAFGRVGCYSVGEHLGGKTAFFLGTRYEGGVTREFAGVNGGPALELGSVIHNTALYELLHLALLFGVLWLLRSARKLGPGGLFVVFLGWYGTARFMTDFLRAYDRERLGLTGAQFMCAGVVIACAVIAVRLIKRPVPAEDGPSRTDGDTTPTARSDESDADPPEKDRQTAVVFGADWDDD